MSRSSPFEVAMEEETKAELDSKNLVPPVKRDGRSIIL